MLSHFEIEPVAPTFATSETETFVVISESMLPIEVDDLLRVSQVCAQFRDAVCCNELWKRKFARRFPDLFRQYTASNTRWREECMERLSCGVKLRSWMSMMSRDFYSHDELSEEAFRGIMSLSDHPRSLLFFNDELATILEDNQP
ncbi:hypothetical protein MRX96_048382 [Rhipicephalus microplus]